MRRLLSLAVLAAVASGAAAQKDLPYNPGGAVPQKPLPKYDKMMHLPAVSVLDDEAHALLTHLNNSFDGTQTQGSVFSEDIDAFSGSSALRVTGLQRHSNVIPGWAFQIAENPKGTQFRYVRFAWKKKGGEGIMVQFHDQNRTWIARYHAGKNVQGWQPSKEVSKDVPAEWTVVTCDLFKDFGAMTVTGMAFTAFDGQYALFDHVTFGRTVADLDAATDAALGKGKPADTLDPKLREAMWEDLFDRDRDRAGTAVRRFLVAAPESAGFIGERLQAGKQSADDVKNRTKRIATLVSQLGIDTDFDTRLAATEELEKLGSAAEPAVRTAFQSTDPEARYRAARLLQRLKLDDGGEASLAGARAGRVVRILERAANTEAKDLLKKMADGGYGAEYLDPATSALTRMK